MIVVSSAPSATPLRDRLISELERDYGPLADSADSGGTILLAVIDENWNAPEHLGRTEVSAAIEQGLPVLAVFLESAQLPTDLPTESPLHKLGRLQNVRIRSDRNFSADLSQLRALVNRLLPVPFLANRLAPEVVQAEREQIDEEAILAGVCEIRQTGGLSLNDFIGELEQIVETHE